MNNKNIDFFGVNKKKQKKIQEPFSLGKAISSSHGLAPSNIKITDNYWGAPNSKFGNYIIKNAKKKTTNIQQSYWSINPKHIPIWLQENDDTRIGKGKKFSNMSEEELKKTVSNIRRVSQTKAERELELREKVERLITPTKRIFTLTTPQARAAEAAVEEKLAKRKMPSMKEIVRYKRIQEKKLAYKKPIYGRIAITKTERIFETLKDKEGNIILNKKTGKPIKVPVIDEMTGEQKTREVKIGEKVMQIGEKKVIQPSAVLKRAESISKGVAKGLRETYGKEERFSTARVKRLVKGGLGQAFGEALLNPQTKQTYRGRPRGPSGKYMIEGKPAFEQAYQDWATKQRALNRITPSIAQEAPIPQEEIQEQMPIQAQVPQSKLASAPMTMKEIEATKQMQAPQRGATQEELRTAQELAQQQDNILNAPSFMKGELHATGGSLLTATGPQIMDAPNAFKGQLRTLNRGDPASMGEIKLGPRPSTNPYGDEFIDIELGSGKPVLKKRIREAWMTGESL